MYTQHNTHPLDITQTTASEYPREGIKIVSNGICNWNVKDKTFVNASRGMQMHVSVCSGAS